MAFQTALDEFLAEKDKTRRLRTVDNLRDRLRLHFSFKCQLAEITHGDILRRLATIPTNAEHDHALSVAKTFFTWAHNRRYIDDNPTRGVSPRGTQSRSRVLSDEEVGRIWAACAEVQHRRGAPLNGETFKLPSLPASFARIVQLLILTGQRRNEIASLKAEYIDLDNKTICLPCSLTKNKRQHLFPIGKLSGELLSQSGRTGLCLASDILFVRCPLRLSVTITIPVHEPVGRG